jgi:hypothetical protein
MCKSSVRWLQAFSKDGKLAPLQENFSNITFRANLTMKNFLWLVLGIWYTAMGAENVIQKYIFFSGHHQFQFLLFPRPPVGLCRSSYRFFQCSRSSYKFFSYFGCNASLCLSIAIPFLLYSHSTELI